MKKSRQKYFLKLKVYELQELGLQIKSDKNWRKKMHATFFFNDIETDIFRKITIFFVEFEGVTFSTFSV